MSAIKDLRIIGIRNTTMLIGYVRHFAFPSIGLGERDAADKAQGDFIIFSHETKGDYKSGMILQGACRF